MKYCDFHPTLSPGFLLFYWICSFYKFVLFSDGYFPLLLLFKQKVACFFVEKYFFTHECLLLLFDPCKVISLRYNALVPDLFSIFAASPMCNFWYILSSFSNADFISPVIANCCSPVVVHLLSHDYGVVFARKISHGV